MTEQVIATCNDYEGLQRAMRVRKETLKLSNATLDAIAGTHDGHAGKMLADPASKNMGVVTIGLLLQALGLKLLVVEDAGQMRRLATQMVERAENQVRVRTADAHAEIIIKLSRGYMKKLSKKAARGRMLKIPRWKRQQLARRAARARWGS